MAFKMSGWSAFTKKDDKPISKIKEGTRKVVEKVAKAGSEVTKKIMKKDNEKGVGKGVKRKRGQEPINPANTVSDQKEGIDKDTGRPTGERAKEVKIVIPKKKISKVEKSEQQKKKEDMDKIIKGK